MLFSLKFGGTNYLLFYVREKTIWRYKGGHQKP